MYYLRKKVKQMLSEESYLVICSFKRNSSRISLSQSERIFTQPRKNFRQRFNENMNQSKIFVCNID